MGIRCPRLQLTEKERGGRLAMDAQPELITISNSGIPAFLSTYIDPKIIEILAASDEGHGDRGRGNQKGRLDARDGDVPCRRIDRRSQLLRRLLARPAIAGANVNWVQRQSYTYQVITQWGERELEKMGLARIDWANRHEHRVGPDAQQVPEQIVFLRRRRSGQLRTAERSQRFRRPSLR